MCIYSKCLPHTNNFYFTLVAFVCFLFLLLYHTYIINSSALHEMLDSTQKACIIALFIVYPEMRRVKLPSMWVYSLGAPPQLPCCWMLALVHM